MFSSCTGLIHMANLPNPDQLAGAHVVDVVDMEQSTVPPSSRFVGKDHPADSVQLTGMSTPGTQFLLPAPGLPTVPLKVAQRIWNLEFIELEEFLPNNKTVMMLETPSSVQEGVLGALRQLQQPGRRVF